MTAKNGDCTKRSEERAKRVDFIIGLCAMLCLMSLAASAQSLNDPSTHRPPIVIANPDAIHLFLTRDEASPGVYQLSPESDGFDVQPDALRQFLANPGFWPPGMNGLRIENAAFVEPLDLSRLQCKLALDFVNCRAQQGIRLDESAWLAPVTFRHSTMKSFSAVSAEFNRGLLFRRVDCENQLDLARSIHGNTLAVFHVKAGNIILADAKLKVDVELLFVVSKAGLDAENAQVSGGFKVGYGTFHQNVQLNNASVSGEFDLGLSTVAGALDMNGAQFGEGVDLSHSTLSSMVMSHATVRDDLVFMSSESLAFTDWSGPAASLDLSNSTVGKFALPHLGLPPAVDLRGLSYNHFYPKCLNCDRPDELARFVLDQLQRQQPYSRQVIDTVAHHLRLQHQPRVANAIDYAIREAERRRPGLSPLHRAWMNIDRVTTGHGFYVHRLYWWVTGWALTYLTFTLALVSPRNTFGAVATRDTARIASAARVLLFTAFANLVSTPKSPVPQTPRAYRWIAGSYRAAGLMLVALALLTIWRRFSAAPAA